MKLFQIQDEWSLDHIKFNQADAPKPGTKEILLEMKAASLNYRDLVVPQQGYGSQTGNLPLIPISDGVGIVKKMAPAITQNPIKPTIDQIFPFDSLLEALQYLSKSKHFGKIGIKF